LVSVKLNKLSVDVQYALAALLGAALLRLVPVILVWPYPVGFDTTAYYIPYMLQNAFPSLLEIFRQFVLIQLVLKILYAIYPHPFVLLDGLAIVLQVALTLSVYVFAIRVAKLKPQLSFFAAVAFSFNLLTLRLTWDQYAMSFGLISGIFALISIHVQRPKLRFLSILFTVLTVLFNPLPAVMLLVTMLVDIVFSFRKFLSNLPEILSFVLGSLFFLVQRNNFTQYLSSPSSSNLGKLVPVPGLAGFLLTSGFLFYTAWALLIFIPILLVKERQGHALFWLYVVLFFAFIAPLIGIFTIYSLWILWFASFPLGIIFGRTMLLYGNYKIVRYAAALTLIATVSISIVYVSSSPLRPVYYPSMAKTYAGTIPAGYLQSTVAISTESKLMQILNSTILSLPPRSTVLLPQEFYGLALTFHNTKNLNLTTVGEVSAQTLFEFVSFKGDYIVWWNLSIPTANFHIVLNNANYTLFLIQ
jgi:hypothetical protein